MFWFWLLVRKEVFFEIELTLFSKFCILFFSNFELSLSCWFKYIYFLIIALDMVNSLFNSKLNWFGSPIYISFTPPLDILLFFDVFLRVSNCCFKQSIWNSFSFNLFSNKNFSVLSFSINWLSWVNLSFKESCNVYNFFANSPFSVNNQAIFSFSLSFSFFKSDIIDSHSSETFFLLLIWENKISLFICRDIFESSNCFFKTLFSLDNKLICWAYSFIIFLAVWASNCFFFIILFLLF